MKKLLLAIAIALCPTVASATCTGVFQPNTYCGNNTGTPQVPFQISGATSIVGPGSSTVGDVAIWNNTTGSSLADLAPGALTGVNDTNVTIALAGTPASALLKATSITLGWTGTLSVARGGTGLGSAITGLVFGNGSTYAAYGGTTCTNQFPRSLNASGVATCATVSLTADVTGTLPIANGGTNATTQGAAAINILPTPTRAGDIVYWDGAAWNHLAGNNVGTQFLQENSSGVPAWSTVAGTGTVTSITPGGGLVSSLVANCSQSAITTAGTLSAAHCINAQTGSSYAIADTDRGQIIKRSNAGAMSDTIAQASTASAFFAGWYTDIQNNSTVGSAGVVTVTATTSLFVEGGSSTATLVIPAGQSARITSDGTNYLVTNRSQGGNSTLQASPSNPTGTANVTGVMMGLGSTCTITPRYSTRVFVHVQFLVSNTISTASATTQLRYGTGAAPSNGAAITGTALGSALAPWSAVANAVTAVSPGGIITGLTPGTAIWLDESMNASTGTSSMTNVSCSAYEF